jgi:hypothetical protein
MIKFTKTLVRNISKATLPYSNDFTLTPLRLSKKIQKNNFEIVSPAILVALVCPGFSNE